MKTNRFGYLYNYLQMISNYYEKNWNTNIYFCYSLQFFFFKLVKSFLKYPFPYFIGFKLLFFAIYPITNPLCLTLQSISSYLPILFLLNNRKYHPVSSCPSSELPNLQSVLQSNRQPLQLLLH